MREVEPLTRVAIEQLISELLYRLDHGQADRLWELYTDDAVSNGPLGLMEGREAIKAWGARRVTVAAGVSRHFIGGLRLSWEGDDLHGCVQYFTFRDSTENPLVPASVGEFHEVYRQVDGAWRIARRQVVPIFGGANATAHAQRLTEGAGR